MSESLDRRLTPREWLTLRLHLLACVWCDWYLRQISDVRHACSAAADSGPSVPRLADDARERIRRRLERDDA
jgi:hypothetical protein